jgi:hypothetical protein
MSFYHVYSRSLSQDLIVSQTYKQLTFQRHDRRWHSQRKARVGRGAPQFDGEEKQRRRPSVCPAGPSSPVLSRERGLAQQVLPSRDAHAEVCAWGNAPEAFVWKSRLQASQQRLLSGGQVRTGAARCKEVRAPPVPRAGSSRRQTETFIVGGEATRRGT